MSRSTSDLNTYLEDLQSIALPIMLVDQLRYPGNFTYNIIISPGGPKLKFLFNYKIIKFAPRGIPLGKRIYTSSSDINFQLRSNWVKFLFLHMFVHPKLIKVSKWEFSLMVEQPTFNRLGLGSNPWTLIYPRRVDRCPSGN
jgi:hypothetical protein